MQFIKKFIPESLLKFIRPYYHGAVALFANIYFGRPSEHLIVIGITGTAGKSTTAAMLASILNDKNNKNDKIDKNFTAEISEDISWKCGYITTVDFFDGEKDYLNKYGLSMPGGWLLQKQLRQMVSKGCKYAVVECTSEGLAQNRHLGINFDIALFTNLSHAHVETHGSFGNYQAAKSKLFKTINNLQVTINKKRINPGIKKMIGVNLDDPISGMFISFPADVKFGVTFTNLSVPGINKVYHAKQTADKEFEIENIKFTLDLFGTFNSRNASLAAACANMLGVDLKDAAAALQNLHNIRGRMEKVPNNLGLTIIVDYGCEPASFKAAVEAAAQQPHNRLIHVFGSTGGHRDASKRFEFGKTSAQYADYIIITNDDVYGSDPQKIAADIEAGIKQFALRKPEYEIILDRRSAIAHALSLAQKNDIVLLTGKGSEQFLVLPGNKRIEWDETSVVKNQLAKLK